MSRFTVDLSPEINNRLTEIARREGITKAEAMRRAFALLSVAEQEKSKGNSLGIVREDPDKRELKAIARVVGI